MKKYLFIAIIGTLLLFACYPLVTHKSYRPAPKPTHTGYIEVDHGQLFYQRFGAGKPIVVIHGGPGLDEGYLLPQMLELAKDHELIFYDQRGSGKSLNTPLDGKYINLNKFVADLEKLRADLGLKDMVLLGHSWGGRVAAHYAMAHPDKVSELILLSPEPLDAEGWDAFMQEWNKRLEPIKDQVKAVFSYEETEKLEARKISEQYRKFFSVYFAKPKDNRYLSLGMSKDSALSGFKVREEMNKNSPHKPHAAIAPALKALKMPTLIIHGQQDVIPIQTAENLKAALPHAQMVALDHCGHFPYIEQPKEMFNAIRLFLHKEDETSKHASLKIQAIAYAQAWS